MLGVGGLVAPPEVGQQVGRQDVADTQAEGAIGEACRHPRRLGGLVGQGQELLGIGQQRLAGGGQLEMARLPEEQRGAEGRLKQGDLLRDARLAHVEQIGRPGKMPRAGHGDKDAEFMQVHPFLLT